MEKELNNKEARAKVLAQREKEFNWIKKEFALTKKIREVQLKGYVPLNPSYKFETDPEYQVLAEEKQKLENEKEDYMIQQKIDEYEEIIEQLRNELEDIKNE